MIGEVRDLETAQIAVQASLTGHLVFSTLHTNDAISAFTRLIDMGLEPFLVASALRGVVAQRLVRSGVPSLRRPGGGSGRSRCEVEESPLCAPPMTIDVPQWRHPVGCRECLGSG